MIRLMAVKEEAMIRRDSLFLHLFQHGDSPIQDQDADGDLDPLEGVGDDRDLQESVKEHGDQIDDGKGRSMMPRVAVTAPGRPAF